MSFTVVRPETNGNRGEYRPRANKLFRDGVEVLQPKGNGPMWWSLVKAVNTDDPLPEIFNTLKEIEANNSDYVILAEPLKETRPKQFGDWFRLKAGEYFVKDYPRNWIQLDFDSGPEGCNSLPLSQRVEVAFAGLPQAFIRCECVAQLSSKAFHPSYPNYLGLRVYLALKTPYTAAQLRNLLKGLKGIDDKIFTNVRRHYTSVVYEGTVHPEIIGDTILYREGKKLDIQALEEDEEYTNQRTQNKTFATVIKNFQTFTPEGGQMEELKRLAEDGYFERVERHTEHWKILKKAEWTAQNGEEVIEAILDAGEGDRTILGNKANRESLEASLEAIQSDIHEHFSYSLSEQKFDHIVTDPKLHDLKGADMSELEKPIKRALDKEKKVHLVIRSPHGSAKTTEIIPILTKLAEDKLGRPARVLYICTLRSIIRGTSKELCFECYLGEDGEIKKHVITSADKLGICIKSLIHTEKPFDVVVRDEAESLGLWAAWNASGDTLRDYSYLNSLVTHKNCIINCLMDADAADLTYNQLERNLRNDNDYSILMENTGSWINALDQTMHFMRKPRQVANKIYDDAVGEGKFCFVNVDFGDKKSNPKLSALTNAFNALAGYEIAKCFWSGTAQEIKNRLQDTPNEYIPQLYEQGIRIIIVSPIIVSGWRYKAVPHFDASYGIYENNISSALDIIQRSQRITHVRDHYNYISPVSSFTSYDTLQSDIEEELEYAAYEHSVVIRQDDAAAKELISKAKAKKNKLHDNVKLHTILYWDSFGGQAKFHEYDEEKELPELEILSDAISEARKAKLHETAQSILDDEDTLAHFTQYFREYDKATSEWVEMHPPNDVKTILALLKIKEDSASTHETAETVCQLLRSTETEWMQWDLFGAEWKTPDVETAAQIPTFANKPTFRCLGQILHELQEQLDPEVSLALTKWLSGSIDTPIVIDTTKLKPEQFPKLTQRYYDLLKTNVPQIFSKGITDYEKFLTCVFRKILGCTVSKTALEGGVVALKKSLVTHYQSQKILPKGDPSKRELQARANTELRTRIKLGFELSDLEQEYFEKSGKLIEVKLPQYRTLERIHMFRNIEMASYTREEVYEAL